MSQMLIVVLAALLALANLLVSVAVARSTTYGRTQRLLQIIFIWLLPIIGAVVSTYVLWNMLREERHVGIKRGDGGNELWWWNISDEREGHSGHDGHDGGADGGH